MDFSSCICILLLVFLTVEAEHLNGRPINENQLEDFLNSKILQQLQVSRQKRSANDDCGSDSSCNKAGGVQPQPIVVNHYHNYYYCCPSVANQFPQPAPQRPVPVYSTKDNHVDCSCDNRGAISCNVPQNPTPAVPQSGGHNYQQNPKPSHVHQQQNAPSNYQQGYQKTPQFSSNNYQPAAQSTDQRWAQTINDPLQLDEPQRQDLKTKDKNNAFSFSMMFDDPIAKDFYDFVTSNFVKRDIPLKIAEVECLSDPLSVLEDPVCKEFFNLFTQSFMRKSDNVTSNNERSQATTQTPIENQTSKS